MFDLIDEDDLSEIEQANAMNDDAFLNAVGIGVGSGGIPSAITIWWDGS